MPAANDPSADAPGGDESGHQSAWNRPGRSVFDDPAPVDPDEARHPGPEHATDVLPVVPGPTPRSRRATEPRGASEPRRAVLDGAAFGVYEEEERRSRVAVVVAALLAVAVLGVGLLVVRAVNADAELGGGDDDAPSTTDPAGDEAPTMEALRALIPEGLDTCVPFGDPGDAPPSVAVLCPRGGVPEGLAFVLYASIADREAEFDRLASEFGVPTSGTDCALGQSGVHDYIGFARVGRVACLSGDDVVDFVWTSDEAPLLVRARGGGSFSDHYAFWDRVVERTDAGFPLPPERTLMGRLPGGLSANCRRDLELNVAAGGMAAIVCEPEDEAPDQVSSVHFRDAEAMSAWIESRRRSLSSNVFGESENACSSSGFGVAPVPETTTVPSTEPPENQTPTRAGAEPTSTAPGSTAPPSTGPVPDAGFTPYDFDGRTGRVLCFMSSSDTNALFWVRDDSLIGSIAVSDRASGASMRELLEWWEAGGHRP